MREQALGQLLGLVVAYILFAVAGVCIIAGASIHYGADTWNVLGYCSALGQPVRLVLCRCWLF
ncbi:cytosine permease [Escherichia coli]